MALPLTILVTGAAGIVGTALRPLLAERYQRVLLTDLAEITDLAPNETFRQGDITDRDFVHQLVNEADGVIHLAGMVGAHFTFDEVLGPNIVGTHHVFEAAYRAKISHVINASSHHAVGFFQRGAQIDHETAHRPDTEYGLSKAFGESAAAYFADKFGLNILTIRIGFVGDEIPNERRLHTWISPRDLAQLVEIGFSTPNLGHEIVYGVSKAPEPFFDNSNAFRLGFEPQDCTHDAVTDPSVLEIQPDLSTIEEGVVGGGFAAVDFAGDAERILAKEGSRAKALSPMIPSRDLAKSGAFFRDLLGFEFGLDSPDYAVLSKNTFSVHLVPGSDPINQMSLYLEVTDLDEVWEILEPHRDSLNVKAPFEREYGMREVHVIIPATEALLFIGQRL